MRAEGLAEGAPWSNHLPARGKMQNWCKWLAEKGLLENGIDKKFVLP